MINSNDRKKMKGPKELEAELEKYQDLYDKYENNAIKQAEMQVKIANCMRQLQLWYDFRKSVD
jgi:hypothetical protein